MMSERYKIAEKVILENSGKLTFNQITQILIDKYNFTESDAKEDCKEFMLQRADMQRFDVHPGLY